MSYFEKTECKTKYQMKACCFCLLVPEQILHHIK